MLMKITCVFIDSYTRTLNIKKMHIWYLKIYNLITTVTFSAALRYQIFCHKNNIHATISLQHNYNER